MTRTEDSDKCHAFAAAHYRLEQRMRSLEAQFEDKAGELRALFVQEISAIAAAE